MVVKELGIDAKRFTPKTFANRISDLKNELVTPQAHADSAVTSNPLERHLVEVYRAYAQRLEAANALDFDDLIVRTVQLLQAKPAVAEMYRRRFRHMDTAASTAFSSSSLRTSSSPRTSRHSSSRRSDCRSGTCLMQTTIFMPHRLPYRRRRQQWAGAP